MNYCPTNYGEFFEKIIQDALERMDGYAPSRPLEASDITLYSWPQVWGSTACGFGGIGGCSMTTAQTVVIAGPCGDVCVYHAGRFAYKINRPNENFYTAMSQHQLPGAGEKHGHLETEP